MQLHAEHQRSGINRRFQGYPANTGSTAGLQQHLLHHIIEHSGQRHQLQIHRTTTIDFQHQ